jgi:mRNA interferase MazF
MEAMIRSAAISVPNMTEKPFDRWNSRKKRIESKAIDPSLYFHEREVWWCSIGVNVGVETDGKNEHFERPVLIVKKFNGSMLWVVPLTSKHRDGRHYHRLRHDKGVSFVCLSQLKTISSKRLLRKIGMAPPEDFAAACDQIARYIQIGPR